jgi:GAF domain-containing protein
VPDPNIDAALTAIRAGARRAVVARRLAGDAENRLLQSIVDATVRLFDAEASSIALFERDPERLEFRVAAGPQGAGAIGQSVKPSQGIAGFTFSTGQALALSDVERDPRFDREAARRTGYVPRSIATVPLPGANGPVGVLQVLDKRSSPTFSLQDMELLAIFATQAATAIEAVRVQHDLVRLLRTVLARLPDDDQGRLALTEEALDRLVSEAVTGLDDDPQQAPFWRLVDHVATLSRLGEREQALVADMLEVVVRHVPPPGRRRA